METNIRSRALAVLLALLPAVTAYCQYEEAAGPKNQYAPTPKALEMTRFGHMPPDLNSGIYSYDIPIYTYEDKNFSIPVSLHYSSSGFQPARMSDEAGLHWTLMAGGTITREIVGIDDFGTDGLYYSDPEVNDSLMYRLIQPANTIVIFGIKTVIPRQSIHILKNVLRTVITSPFLAIRDRL